MKICPAALVLFFVSAWAWAANADCVSRLVRDDGMISTLLDAIRGMSVGATADELGWRLGAPLTDRQSATHDIREVRPQWFQVTNTP